MITDRDMKQQALAVLADDADDFDVDKIVETIHREYGLVDIDVVPDQDFWDIVKENAR